MVRAWWFWFGVVGGRGWFGVVFFFWFLLGPLVFLVGGGWWWVVLIGGAVGGVGGGDEARRTSAENCRGKSTASLCDTLLSAVCRAMQKAIDLTERNVYLVPTRGHRHASAIFHSDRPFSFCHQEGPVARCQP